MQLQQWLTLASNRLNAAGVSAHKLESQVLAGHAMLVDRTPPGDVADALRLDRRRVQRRTERLLGQLRDRPSTGVAA